MDKCLYIYIRENRGEVKLSIVRESKYAPPVQSVLYISAENLQEQLWERAKSDLLFVQNIIWNLLFDGQYCVRR